MLPVDRLRVDLPRVDRLRVDRLRRMGRSYGCLSRRWNGNSFVADTPKQAAGTSKLNQ